MTVSMLGDGVYLVALAWQVYELSNVPTALSIVGVAWTAPMVVFLLIGGVMSDRFDRRVILILSDAIRGIAVTAIAVLSLLGEIELWHMYALVAVYGVGDAFFGPAFGAIVPDIVPTHMLVEANSLGQLVRPFAERLAGPAVGGFTIALVGVGNAFLIDAATFIVSALCLWFLQSRPVLVSAEEGAARKVRAEIADGLRFVRSKTWLWATLLSAALSLLFYLGPFEVLVPFIVKNSLGGGGDDLGLVFAAGGVGAIAVSLMMSQRGLPRRHITFMYWTFGVAIGSVAGFALVTALWQAMLLSLVEGACVTAGMIVWGTMMHRLVPTELLGRVQSLDWLVSIALVPLSFAVTGPIADSIGVDTTLIAAGILGALATLSFLLIPSLHDTEKDGSLRAVPPLPRDVVEQEVPSESRTAIG